MTPRWQRATMNPSWIRWLPCAHAYLTVVPDSGRFPRSTWDAVVPWDDPVWCDPGDIEDWMGRAARRPGRRAEPAERQIRARYAQVLALRETRIDVFADMCRRRDLPVPHTVTELLTCLAGLGLFDLDGATGDPWVRPHLDRDPLDVLPLSPPESDLERLAQRDDRAVQVAIAVRRLAVRTRRRWPRRRTVGTTFGAVAGLAGVTPQETRQALDDLAGLAGLRADPGDRPDAVRITVPWPEFGQRFPFSELPAPEHAI
ncbi:hypothetical protein [Polymorphospora sp. NPDC050346]|uniref:hypothetical protein n=1 Tax=Polymorphospora sp. NPDC050346 TaxID=3155780 RepID=UPI0033C366FA